MKPQDHSDTTLLVWADWLEENGQEQKAHDLREEIETSPAKRWNWEHRRYGGISVGDAGDRNDIGGCVGGDISGIVGSRVGCSTRVGGGMNTGVGDGRDSVGGVDG